MRRVLLSMMLVACGGPRAPRPSLQPPPAIADAGTSASADAGPVEEVPSLDAIAARGASEAPEMRIVLRVADATKPIDLPAADRDVCYRAIVASSRPVRARLEDATKAARGDAAPNATSLLVPPRGPACAKKGEVLRLVVDAETGTVARAVVFQSP